MRDVHTHQPTHFNYASSNVVSLTDYRRKRDLQRAIEDLLGKDETLDVKYNLPQTIQLQENRNLSEANDEFIVECIEEDDMSECLPRDNLKPRLNKIRAAWRKRRISMVLRNKYGDRSSPPPKPIDTVTLPAALPPLASVSISGDSIERLAVPLAPKLSGQSYPQ